MLKTTLPESLGAFINDPKNPIYNYTLGARYEEQGQLAAAISYYLRSAEFSLDPLLSYEALIRVALCTEKQGDRNFHTKTILLRAISFMPTRPEAIYHLSRSFEITKEWLECYTWACMGETLQEPTIKLFSDVGYPGSYGFTYHRAISAWWIGQADESIHYLRVLYKRTDLLDYFYQSVFQNIINIQGTPKHPIIITNEDAPNLRAQFPGADSIYRNYSQCCQDIFVLMMTKGMEQGTFLEIGCDHPTKFSNTFLLESQFRWEGISIDVDVMKIDEFRKTRKSIVINADATKINYEGILTYRDYTYLQIDCEPALNSFIALQRIPFHNHRFAVITFEHDHYVDRNTQIQSSAQKYLESFGYVLVVNNIAEDRYSNFEDWYIHPELVDPDLVKRMKCISPETKKADDYILNRI
jgi:hypothetical protein